MERLRLFAKKRNSSGNVTRKYLVVTIVIAALISATIARGGHGGRGGRGRGRSRSRSRSRYVVIDQGGRNGSACLFTDNETGREHIGPCPSNPSKTGLIIGGVFGSLGFITGVCTIHCLCKKKKSPLEGDEPQLGPVPTHSPPTYEEYVNGNGPSNESPDALDPPSSYTSPTDYAVSYSVTNPTCAISSPSDNFGVTKVGDQTVTPSYGWAAQGNQEPPPPPYPAASRE